MRECARQRLPGISGRSRAQCSSCKPTRIGGAARPAPRSRRGGRVAARAPHRSAPIECRGRCAPLCAPSCAALRLGGCRGRTRVRRHKVHVFPPSTKRWLVLGASAKRTGCGDGAVMVMGRRRKATRNKVSTSAPSRTHARTHAHVHPPHRSLPLPSSAPPPGNK